MLCQSTRRLIECYAISLHSGIGVTPSNEQSSGFEFTNITGYLFIFEGLPRLAL